MTAPAVAAGRIKMLRIEIDGHFHGSSDVPQPWVARIDGVDGRYGLARHFVQKLNDYSNAKRAWSGNLYRVMASFPLRAGHLYEVSRLEGSSSKRHVARRFWAVDDDCKMTEVAPLDVLARVEGHASDVFEYQIKEPGPEERVLVSEISGVGAGSTKGWVVINRHRHYRLRHGLIYELVGPADGPRLVLAGATLRPLNQEEALRWLAEHHRQRA